MLDGRWHFVWPLLGLASAFHVLVGGWAVVAAVPVYWFFGRAKSSVLSQVIPLAVGGLFAMAGLYPALVLTKGVSPELVSAAARIYSYERLTHHLLPSAIEAKHYLRHGLLVGLTFAAIWRLRDDLRYRMLGLFALGTVVIAVAGLGISLLRFVEPDLVAKLLRYYWFRMTDSIVPLTFALCWPQLPRLITTALYRKRLQVVVAGVALWAVIDAFAEASRMTVRTESGKVVSAIAMNTNSANRRRVMSDWIAVCEWVDRTLPKDEILLTPRNQQSFKWYANRAEVVNWKDVPQDAASLVEWSRRFYDVYPRRLGTVRVTVRYTDLLRFKEQYGVRFMIVDRRYSGQSLPLVQVYPVSPHESNEHYAVYRLP
jgi:hypothetical protein